MKPRRISIVLVSALLGCAKDSGDGRSAAAPSSPPAAPADTPAAVSFPSVPASADTAAAVWVLDEHGVGPVRVGMRVAQADSATPGGLDRTTDLRPECDVLHPRRRLPAFDVLVEDARVARVDARDRHVATHAGARLGDSEALVRRLYPTARVRPHKYNQHGHYLIVIPGAPADTLYRVVFGTDGKVVTELRGGLWPPVEYVEGCS